MKKIRKENVQLHTSEVATYLKDVVKPARADYASIPTLKGYNWDLIGEAIWQTEQNESKQNHKYLVVFRSKRKEDANIALLESLETQSLEDAEKSGGLIVYSQGPLRDDRKNVSFCIWRSAEMASLVSSRSPHSNAKEIVKKFYERYEIERYLLKITQSSLGIKTVLMPIERNPALAKQQS